MMFWKHDLSGQKRNKYLGWFILLLGFIGTFVLVWEVDTSTREEDELRFNYEISQILKTITYRMIQYEIVMDQTKALFLSSKDVTREEFHEFTKNSGILQSYPGLRGIGYALFISPASYKETIRKAQSELPGFKVFPEPTGNEMVAPIYYFERIEDPTNNPIGFDLYHEPVRREGLIQAWKTGEPTISQRISLLEGNKTGNDPGFLMSIPLYGIKDKNPVGFIFAPIVIEKLFDSIFIGRYDQLDVEIYEGEKISKKHLIYDLDKRSAEYKIGTHELEKTRTLPIHNNVMTLRFYPLEKFNKQHSYLEELLLFLTGTGITLLIFWIYRITCNQVIMTQKARDTLEQSVQARDEFFSIASHEFKTPLTSLKLQNQIFRRAALKKDPKVFTDDYILSVTQVLDNQLVRIERLVDDMLDVSRIRTGRLRIEKSDFSLAELVKDVISRMSEQLKILPEKAPIVYSNGESIGHWDKLRIEQVITNLLSNAIKYGHETTVVVDIIGSQHEVLLKVKDHGEGIDPSNHCKIFNRFEQVGITPRGVAGLGLGLFITKRIVEAHKGKIWVESELGKGACFVVRLPKNA